MPFASALTARPVALVNDQSGAVRLFNGFYEGEPQLVVERYARTLVLHNYADPPEAADPTLAAAQAFYQAALPWLRVGLVKQHRAAHAAQRQGAVVFGDPAHLDRRLRENGVRYALDVQLNQDSSFYLDTRPLREWAKAQLGGKRVLNTFAYTGSLGVAALAGGAAQVVQLDLSRTFLNLAKDSYALNGFPVKRSDFLAMDFWPGINQLKRAGAVFDCVLVDPPFFSTTGRGTVDLQHSTQRVLNKVRPLIADGGWLVAVNNALFLSGADYLAELQALCADGYLTLETLLPIPADITGYPTTRVSAPPVDPAPFNHPTKIAILRVRRKT